MMRQSSSPCVRGSRVRLTILQIYRLRAETIRRVWGVKGGVSDALYGFRRKGDDWKSCQNDGQLGDDGYCCCC